MTGELVAVAHTMPSRRAFIADLDEAFRDAGVSYAILHGYEQSVADSDVDVVVSPRDVDVVDALIRSGALGTPLQVIRYDVPWCRYYVVGTTDADRPYRQLDISCDPWGLSMLGRSLHRALVSASGSLGRPGPAEETFLLLAKRAHKGLRRVGDADALVASFEAAPAAAARLLEDELGEAGARAASELASGSIDPRTLRAVEAAIAARRRRPVRLVRRTAFSLARTVARLRRPTGLVVVLAGPDGVGKSTLAAALLRSTEGLFWRAAHLHLGPSVLPPPGRLLGRPPRDFGSPHEPRPSSRTGSVARLAYLWLDALLAWAPQVAMPKRRSALVVIERGWRDLEVDPGRYRLQAPRRLTAALASLQPRPDLVLVLDVPAEEVARRKDELPVAEVTRQLVEWRRRAASDSGRYVLIDAAARPEQVEAAARQAIEERLAVRTGFPPSLRLAFAALGDLRADAARHVLMCARGRPRWVLPARGGGHGPRRLGLYRPFRAQHAVAAAAYEVYCRAGAPRGRSLPLAVERGLAPAVAGRLGVASVELAAATTGDGTRGRRVVLSVSVDGEVCAYAKLAVEGAAALHREAAVLRALTAARPSTIVTPSVLDLFTWREATVLLLERIAVASPADRPLGPVELDALAELQRLAPELGATLEGDAGGVPVHGDFAPWNSALLEDGRLALWDWEDARFGLPFEDAYSWRTARTLRGRGPSIDAIVADALAPGPWTARAAERLGASAADAPGSLHHLLEITLGTPPIADHPGVAELRSRGLALLAGRR